MQFRVDLPFDLAHCREQLFKSFGGQIFCLDGNYNPIGNGQSVDGEHIQGGLAVYEDVGILPLYTVQVLMQNRLLQNRFPAHGICQRYLHAGQLNIRWHIEIRSNYIKPSRRKIVLEGAEKPHFQTAKIGLRLSYFVTTYPSFCPVILLGTTTNLVKNGFFKSNCIKPYQNCSKSPENLSFTLIRKYSQQLIINADKQGANKSREHIAFISGRFSAFLLRNRKPFLRADI